MNKIEISDSPSSTLVNHDEVTITDALGRIITLRKPGVLAQFRLIEALGDAAKNEVYVSMVLPLIFVSQIDNDVVRSPTTKLQVEALIQKLDEAGVTAVATGVQEHFGAQDPEEAKKKSDE